MRTEEISAGDVRMARRIMSHCDLEVYVRAFEAAMRIFEFSRKFPKEETYSLTDQVRRSSRSVCTNGVFAHRQAGQSALRLAGLPGLWAKTFLQKRGENAGMRPPL